ncbi:MAG TPA: amidohydrolase family protein, partial [Methylomirabilota bacterium]|nr:amidohydrolase family protein [Methylomirabilota bacterium]
MLDVLIKGGTVVDGSGAPGRPADVAITGDRVVAVEPLPAAGAARVIDATGLAVAPGFIDMHSHADFVLPGLPTADSKVHQGFTLEVVGNCGASPAPLSPLGRQDVIDTSALVVPPLDLSTEAGDNRFETSRSGDKRERKCDAQVLGRPGISPWW